MNGSSACTARVFAALAGGVDADVRGLPRTVNPSLQTMASTAAFRMRLWSTDMANQQNQNQNQRGNPNEGGRENRQQQQQNDQKQGGQQGQQRNQQQGGNEEEE